MTIVILTGIFLLLSTDDSNSNKNILCCNLHTIVNVLLFSTEDNNSNTDIFAAFY